MVWWILSVSFASWAAGVACAVALGLHAENKRLAKMPPRCGSKMCSEPHEAIYGRCCCVLPFGHVGVHSCGGDFYLSEFAEVTQ